MARKRVNGEGSFRKRSNGTWEGRVIIGTDPETGKLISKSVYARTQREVKEKMAALLEEQQNENSSSAASLAGAAEEADPEMTVGEWLDTWLRDYLVDVKPGTIISYTGICERYLKPAFGTIPLSGLKPPMIQRLYNQIKAKGLNPKTIKNIHGCLHRALDVAVRIEYLQRNPTSSCVIPKVVEKKVEPLDGVLS